MNALAPLQVGWCPGALRPMASGDGLILRVKPRSGTLSLHQAVGIAAISARYGNGALDLTNRAHLQIRGVSERTLSAAIESLDDLGLLDADPGAEAARNVTASPMAGFDPEAVLDIRPAVERLEDRLASDETLHGLPAKFGFVVDDGGALSLAGVPADVRFEAVRLGREAALAVRLAGDDAVSGLCGAAEVAAVAAALARLFIEGRKNDPELRRMRQFVERKGAETILRHAGLAPGPPQYRREPVGFRQFVGVRPGFLGIAAPFGRLSADQLEIVADRAGQGGVDQLRLTPWRAILIPRLDPRVAHEVAQACEALGLIVDPTDPRLRVAACPGAPSCHRGTTPVLDHAARLARRLGPFLQGEGIALHVSGCAKGCAHGGRAPLTLVAQDGLYGVIRNGAAGDTPVLHGLTAGQAERCLLAPLGIERDL